MTVLEYRNQSREIKQENKQGKSTSVDFLHAIIISIPCNQFFVNTSKMINRFQVNVPFLYTLKHQKTRMISGIFKEYRKRTLT